MYLIFVVVFVVVVGVVGWSFTLLVASFRRGGSPRARVHPFHKIRHRCNPNVDFGSLNCGSLDFRF